MKLLRLLQPWQSLLGSTHDLVPVFDKNWDCFLGELEAETCFHRYPLESDRERGYAT